MSGALLIRNVEIDGARGLDVRVSDGRISEIGPGLRGCEPDLDGRGGALLPGLIDHHIHLLALAAQRASLWVGPADLSGPDALQARLAAADRSAPPGAWLRAIGYHESVAGELDRTSLDRLAPDRPLRVQHRSGALWVLNSPALAALNAAESDVACIERDAAGAPTGRIWRGDAWLRARLPTPPPPLGAVMGDLAAMGLTGVTDASASNSASEANLFEAARASGDLPQKLMLMAAGPLPASRAYRIGPVKILLDDDGLGDVEAMTRTISGARRQGRCVAVHCVSAVQLAFALAAFDEAGAKAGDRIEHGGVIDDGALAQIVRLGLTVVTQPGFVAERGDQYRQDLDADDLAHLYPCARLLRAGAPVAASTDAPYTNADPWAAMRAAIERRSRSGALLGAHERVDAKTALRLFLGRFDDPGGPPRRVDVGAAADLCLLRTPLAPALLDLRRDLVQATVIDGFIVRQNAGPM